MSVASLRALIYAVVNSVPNAGTVHDYFRYANDVTGMYDLYKTTIGSTVQLRGWAIKWLGFEQTQESLGRDDLDILRLHHWQIDGWMGLDDSATTEKTFDNLVEQVCEYLDGSASLNTWSVCLYREPADCTVDHVIFGGNLCHHATILFDIMENNALGGGFLFYDSFTDDDGPLSAHTPDIDRAGNGWDANAACEISTNRLFVETTDNAVVDVEESDLTIETVWVTSGSRIDLGICARETDIDNSWLIVVDTLTADKFYILKREAGSNTVQQSVSIALTDNDDITFRAVLNGTTITATVADESGHSYSLTHTGATFQQTATSHGIYVLGTPSVYWDYIKMYWAAFGD